RNPHYRRRGRPGRAALRVRRRGRRGQQGLQARPDSTRTLTMIAKLPLDGIRVVEFVHMVMGPTCGLILADLGAEVIKIEPLEGAHTRKLTASGAGFFPTYNRNKKSLALDLKAVQAREAVLKLIATADVVSENFRPGAMDKLGFGYEAVKKIRPQIVYCSHKGF